MTVWQAERKTNANAGRRTVGHRQTIRLTADSLTGWKTVRLTNRQTDRLTKWQTDWLTIYILTGWQTTDWQTNKLTSWQADKLKDWPADKLTDWQADRLTSWQSDRLSGTAERCQVENWQTSYLYFTVYFKALKNVIEELFCTTFSKKKIFAYGNTVQRKCLKYIFNHLKEITQPPYIIYVKSFLAQSAVWWLLRKTNTVLHWRQEKNNHMKSWSADLQNLQYVPCTRILKNNVSYITFIGVKRRDSRLQHLKPGSIRSIWSLDGLSSIDYISFLLLTRENQREVKVTIRMLLPSLKETLLFNEVYRVPI
jgi:hypothetical protein